MFNFDIERVRENIQKATTEDLLDRITVYRMALEPAALEAVLAELTRRGITPADMVQHGQQRGSVLHDAAGLTRTCGASQCHKPAIVSAWGWHRLFGKVPIFPRAYYWCEEHRPSAPADETPPDDAASTA